MKFIGERVSVSQEGQKTSIIISPDYDNTKQSLLLGWIILWFLAGLFVVAQLFMEYSREERMFLFVWAMFWLYFLYVGIMAYSWKKWGLEKLLIKDGVIKYYRSLKGLKKPVTLEKEMINEINLLPVSEKSLLFNLSNSYWNKGNETCEIRYAGKSIGFGLKLTQGEATTLISIIRKGLKP